MPRWRCACWLFDLLFLPTGFEGALVYQEAERCTARVLSVDDSAIIDTGLVRSGEQRCQLEILDGMFQGQTVSGVNMLNGSLEQDKVFQPGDKALVVVSHDGDTITNVTMSDHYRLSWELVMAIGFAIFLILFAGPTGVRAIASFVLTVLTLWKVLVPLYLKGYNPIWIGLAITLFLTVLIIALVYGFDRRCWAAVSGSFLGILVTCVLGVLFTDLFQIHGAVMSYSESLLYSGYQDLNLTQIFMASIFIGASGAIMDLSVDITSAVYEVVEKRPDLTWWEATRSGMNVGRAAMGTMTTTLLFAYSGGVCSPADGVYGSGYSGGEHPQLQVCGRRAYPHGDRLLRPGDGGPLYRPVRRGISHPEGKTSRGDGSPEGVFLNFDEREGPVAFPFFCGRRETAPCFSSGNRIKYIRYCSGGRELFTEAADQCIIPPLFFAGPGEFPARHIADTTTEGPMEKDVIISIKGTQKYENADPDVIELVTEGRLEREGSSYTLSYQESELTGLEGTLTTFQIEPERVTLLRVGEYNSQMVFQEGRRHMAMYNTPLRSHDRRGEYPPSAGRAG